MGLPAIPYSSATPTTTTKTRRSLNLKNTMICPTRGHDFTNLHRLLTPLNRAKQCFVLFGLMAVSLTCLHVFSGGSGLRRRLPYRKNYCHDLDLTVGEWRNPDCHYRMEKYT